MTTAETPTIEATPVQFRWSDVFQGGAIMDLECRYWTGAKGLVAEDLAMELSAGDKRTMALGFKRLIPTSAIAKFKSIENSAFRLISMYTRSFPGTSGRFVPVSVLPELTAKMDELKIKFVEATEEFLDKYSAMKEAVRPDFEELTKSIWAQVGTSGSYTNYESYRVAFMARLEEAYPNVETLRSKFSFDSFTYTISAPDPSITGIKQAEEQRVRRFLSAAANEARASVREAVEKMVNVVDGNGIRATSVNALKGAFERFKQLDFLGDEELLGEIERMETDVLSKFDAETFRSDESALAALRGGIAGVAKAAVSVTDDGVQRMARNLTTMGKRKLNF